MDGLHRTPMRRESEAAIRRAGRASATPRGAASLPRRHGPDLTPRLRRVRDRGRAPAHLDERRALLGRTRVVHRGRPRLAPDPPRADRGGHARRRPSRHGDPDRGDQLSSSVGVAGRDLPVAGVVRHRLGPARGPLVHLPAGGGYPGTTATVIVRAIDFGVAGDPATVSIQLVGATRPPTETLTQSIDTSLTPRSDWFFADKDTVLYQDAVVREQWSRSVPVGGPQDHGLLLERPPASLALELRSRGPDAAGARDRRGRASSRGDRTRRPSASRTFRIPSRSIGSRRARREPGTRAMPMRPATSSTARSRSFGADWEFRSRPVGPWSVPGGDPTGDPLVSAGVNLAGPALPRRSRDFATRSRTWCPARRARTGSCSRVRGGPRSSRRWASSSRAATTRSRPIAPAWRSSTPRPRARPRARSRRAS